MGLCGLVGGALWAGGWGFVNRRERGIMEWLGLGNDIVIASYTCEMCECLLIE